ncbi:MAG: YitT family protein [Clostridiaceae bacterium]|nr:YitT family protein [Clostridiaceae bacterium]
MNFRADVKEFAIITFATALVGAAVFFFIIPSGIPVGSVSGLALILSNIIPLKISVITFILNMLLLVIGFIFIGREFGGKTVYTSIIMPVFMGLFEILFPNNRSIMGDPVLDMICFMFVASVGLAILFNHNASSGGLDIIAKLMNKVLRMDLGKAMAISGMCAALCSAFVYAPRTVILSLLGTYINGLVLDHFIFGFNVKKRVCILSEREDAIKNFILRDLHSGATIYEAIGAYDNRVRREIIAIVDQSEYKLLMNYINKADPDAFVTVYAVNEVLYKPKAILPLK